MMNDEAEENFFSPLPAPVTIPRLPVNRMSILLTGSEFPDRPITTSSPK